MKHPVSRAERRAVREIVIANRRFIYEYVWKMNERPSDQKFTAWSRYAKFNLGCGCKECHSAKYLDQLEKRRRNLKRSESQAEFRKGDNVIKY